MRMPPPGKRFAAATRIAVGAALSTVVVGSAALLTVRESMPERIVVRWDDARPKMTLDLASTLVLGAALTMVACAVVLGIGLAMHRSRRHGLAGYAAGASVALGLGFYAMTVGQAFREGPDSSILVLPGLAVAALVCWRLTTWVRLPATAGAVPPPLAAMELPASARLMWSGGVPSPLSTRLAMAAMIAVPLALLYWWIGMSIGMTLTLLGAVVAGRLLAFRQSQFAIDYSGAGLRAQYANRPKPIRLGDIRSAEAGTISALRDFGGWGHVTAPDGREGWITRSGEALVIHRRSMPDFVVTVDGADEAAIVLNTLVARLEVA